MMMTSRMLLLLTVLSIASAIRYASPASRIKLIEQHNTKHQSLLEKPSGLSVEAKNSHAWAHRKISSTAKGETILKYGNGITNQGKREFKWEPYGNFIQKGQVTHAKAQDEKVAKVTYLQKGMRSTKSDSPKQSIPEAKSQEKPHLSQAKSSGAWAWNQLTGVKSQSKLTHAAEKNTQKIGKVLVTQQAGQEDTAVKGSGVKNSGNYLQVKAKTAAGNGLTKIASSDRLQAGKAQEKVSKTYNRILKKSLKYPDFGGESGPESQVPQAKKSNLDSTLNNQESLTKQDPLWTPEDGPLELPEAPLIPEEPSESEMSIDTPEEAEESLCSSVKEVTEDSDLPDAIKDIIVEEAVQEVDEQLEQQKEVDELVQEQELAESELQSPAEAAEDVIQTLSDGDGQTEDVVLAPGGGQFLQKSAAGKEKSQGSRKLWDMIYNLGY